MCLRTGYIWASLMVPICRAHVFHYVKYDYETRETVKLFKKKNPSVLPDNFMSI